MAQTSKLMEELYAHLVLEDEEDVGIFVTNNEIVEQKQTYVLVGNFLT